VLICNEIVDNCPAPDTLVPTARGVLRADELRVGDCLQSVDDELRLSTNHIISTELGESELLRLRFRSGSEISVTPQHPLMTPQGWVSVDQLRVGDPVAGAARLRLPVEPTGEFPYTAGALTGDAHFGRSSWNGNPTTPVLSSWDREVVDSCRAEGATLNKLRAVGCWSVLADTWKRLPPSLWQRDCNKHIPAEYEGSGPFLSGLFDTDGSVSGPIGKGRGRIEFASLSERLARDVQRGLLYFGVTSTVGRYARKKPSGAATWIWLVHISGRDNAERFEKHIGFKICE